VTELRYAKHERLSLRDHPQFNERWLQARIAEDPSLLGLGDVVLKDKERIHPRAGRLDLLLQEPETGKRFEVEVQLGRTDEAHVIRTIEYWDIERKRYPQYEHAAVLVAEDITSRFLNVISLFNGFIPFIAVQLNAIAVNGAITLVGTTVLDEVQLGLVEEDEEVQVPSDRAYWEGRSSRESLALVDSLHQVVRSIDPTLELKYNRHYIGLARGEQPDNFVIFRPARNWLQIGLALDKTDSRDLELEKAGLDVMRYDTRWGKYLVRLQKEDVSKHGELLHHLMREASER
jgi:hypothetical protein